MATNANAIEQLLDDLSSEQLQQVADFIAFLNFQDQKREADLDPLQSAPYAPSQSNRPMASTAIGGIQPMFD